MLRVFKRFSRQAQALSNISLSVHWGDFLSIEGPPGAGKSTLLRLMGLFEKPSQGQMVVDGADVGSLHGERAFARRRRLIRLTPTDSFFPKLNLKDNLRLAVDVAGPPLKPGPKPCMDALALVGLAGLWRQTPPQLQPAQRLRLLLARALIRRPRMLLIDGCMDNLEEAERKSWLGTLGPCREGGATVIVAGECSLREGARRFKLEGGFLHAVQAGEDA